MELESIIRRFVMWARIFVHTLHSLSAHKNFKWPRKCPKRRNEKIATRSLASFLIDFCRFNDYNFSLQGLRWPTWNLLFGLVVKRRPWTDWTDTWRGKPGWRPLANPKWTPNPCYPVKQASVLTSNSVASPRDSSIMHCGICTKR